MSLGTYSPKQHALVCGGVPISGFAKDTFIKISHDDDAFTDETGADGFTQRVQNHSQGGMIEITLMQGSPSNDVLNSFAKADRLSGKGSFEMLCKDINGTTTAFSEDAWVKKLPDSEFGTSVKTRTWVIKCACMAYDVGGNR